MGKTQKNSHFINKLKSLPNTGQVLKSSQQYALRVWGQLVVYKRIYVAYSKKEQPCIIATN